MFRRRIDINVINACPCSSDHLQLGFFNDSSGDFCRRTDNQSVDFLQNLFETKNIEASSFLKFVISTLNPVKNLQILDFF